MDNEPKSSDPNDAAPSVEPTPEQATDPVTEKEYRIATEEEQKRHAEEEHARAIAQLPFLMEVTHRFKHHVPTPQQIGMMEDLQKTYSYLGKLIVALCPANADRTHALRVLLDSKMWANASIMLHQESQVEKY